VSEVEMTEILAQPAPGETCHGAAQSRWRPKIGWLLLVLLPWLAITLRTRSSAWVFMWLLAAAIFAGCKWQTWWQARMAKRIPANWKRNAAYLLLWPGMDTQEFFDATADNRRVPPIEWRAAIGKTLAGVGLIEVGARVVRLGHPMWGGWSGMLGLVLFLHFGTLHFLALAWRQAGLGVRPIMQRPLGSRSLGELWGKRWNLGFRTLSHQWVFQPLQKRFGLTAGTLGAFLASGLLHELVISAPSGAGYGLPTAYFLTQGLGVLAERSETGKRFGLGRGVRGWLWTALIAAGPVFVLFHPWFVMRVMVPFLCAIAG